MRGCHSRSPPLDEPHEHDEDDGSNEADEKFAQEAASHGDAAEGKTSEPASCDSQQDVYEKAIASALHDLSGRPARERAEREFHDQPHGAILLSLSLIHISEPTRLGMISYAVFCL